MKTAQKCWLSPGSEHLALATPSCWVQAKWESNLQRADQARGDKMMVYGSGDDLKSAWDSAMLLAGYFRIWPTAMPLGARLGKSWFGLWFT